MDERTEFALIKLVLCIMVEKLKLLSQYLTFEIGCVDKNLLGNADLELDSERIAKLDELPPDINFIHMNKQHASWYPLATCKEYHCFPCLVFRLNNKKTACEHGKQFSKFELVHIQYLDKLLKKA